MYDARTVQSVQESFVSKMWRWWRMWSVDWILCRVSIMRNAWMWRRLRPGSAEGAGGETAIQLISDV